MRIQKDNIDKWFDYNILADTRTIMLADEGDKDRDGGVDDQMANYFMKAMHILEHQKPGEAINIEMRTHGGCWYAGMAIYDRIKASKCHVKIEVFGSAFSMGSIILQAADERVMHPNSLMMIHDGTMSADDPIRTFTAWADTAKEQRRAMYNIFAERSGKTWKYWEKKCESDYILKPEVALKEKLIDKIAGKEEPTHE